jgi:molecular chaperone HscC
MIIGIDLGTTNSLLAIWESGTAKVIPNVLGKLLTPSVISVEEDSILIGEPALNRLMTHSQTTVANFKRFMGTDKVFKLGNYSFRAEELSALILKRLKEDAEAFLGTPITEAVITVPAYFSDAQRKATKIAGKLAGLKVERLINEPTAAGIAYGLQQQENETNYLIFDLGGGTFDVSILTMFSGIIEVRASNGDNLLGGLDFTKILEDMFVKNLKENGEKEVSKELLERISEQAEIAKRSLSSKEETIMRVLWDSKILEYKISNQDFEYAVEPLLQRLRNPLKKVLHDANLTTEQIQNVVLVGGASRMHVVKKIVARMFGKFPLSHIEPDTVVVKGAAIQAGLKADDQALEEIVITDVCPYSLGVGICSQHNQPGSSFMHFDPIIERNTVIPTSRSRLYRPSDPTQKMVDIKIYQGESFSLDKNVFLGLITIDLPPSLNVQAIDIRFTYDINGLLEVETTILETGQKKNLIIEGNPGVLSEEQINERLQALKKLKIHPREQTENLLVLSRAERLYEDLQGDKRTYLATCIKYFINTLDTQDTLKISRMRQQLDEIIENLKTEDTWV